MIDPHKSENRVEARGRVQLEESDAVRVDDDIAERYTGKRPYFGGVVPAALTEIEHPVTCRPTPASVHNRPALTGPATQMPPAPPLPAASEGGCRQHAPLPADHLDVLDQPVVAAKHFVDRTLTVCAWRLGGSGRPTEQHGLPLPAPTQLDNHAARRGREHNLTCHAVRLRG